MAPSPPLRPVAELEPGMVVAEDVRTPTGRLLVRAGAVLSRREIRGFHLWGVEAVRLAGAGEPDPEAQEETCPRIRLSAEEEARLRDRFRHLDPGDPVVAVLADYCRHRLARGGA